MLYVKRLLMVLTRRLREKHSALTVSHEDAMSWFGKEGNDKLIAAVSPYIKNDAIIFDVGANIGYFTFLLNQKLGFNGEAYLFEPVPHLASLCKVTFHDASFKVNVLNYGLSDIDADEDIFIASDGNIGWNTLISEKATSDMTKILIKLKTFDTAGIDAQPSFIKVDVEGAEYKVFRGMLQSLKNWKHLPVVLCEIGWGNLHPAWNEEMKVFDEMKQLGYTICNLDGIPINSQYLDQTTDVLFIPKENQSRGQPA